MKLFPKLIYQDLLILSSYNHRIKHVSAECEMREGKISDFSNIVIYLFSNSVNSERFAKITLNRNIYKGEEKFNDPLSRINKNILKDLLKKKLLKRPNFK